MFGFFFYKNQQASSQKFRQLRNLDFKFSENWKSMSSICRCNGTSSRLKTKMKRKFWKLHGWAWKAKCGPTSHRLKTSAQDVSVVDLSPSMLHRFTYLDSLSFSPYSQYHILSNALHASSSENNGFTRNTYYYIFIANAAAFFHHFSQWRHICFRQLIQILD